MTCDQSRDEYISAIEDVAAITRYLAEQTGEYLHTVRSSPAWELADVAAARQKIAAAVERLVREERAALERYRRDGERHAAPVARAVGAVVPLREPT